MYLKGQILSAHQRNKRTKLNVALLLCNCGKISNMIYDYDYVQYINE